MRAATDWADFLQKFEVDSYPGMYVLGSYSRYATLYAQQVRALNLIAALADTETLQPNMPIAVVGGGAAGLTASAAAALLGARVTLLERLEDVMELQRNNRQRWIHPHIYDWPISDDPSDRARLPILDWEAGYAEHVAAQLTTQWEEIARETGRITAHLGVQVNLERNRGSNWVSWTGHEPQAFPVVVLAIGFGLEPRTGFRWSYWEEDSIDAGLWRDDTKETWLVSGYGDSALTDLMRLRIRRFRHAELPTLFSRDREALAMVKQDLIEIHANEGAADAEFLTRRFNNLETGNLEKVLEPRLRRGLRVFLTGDGPHRYQPTASLLNRFMLRLLTKLGAYEYIPGKVLQVKPMKQGFSVKFPSGSKTFDHVILRHAPHPSLATYEDIHSASESVLRPRWQFRSALEDPTRRRYWFPQHRFGRRELSEELGSQAAFERLGVGIKTLIARKELWNDGRAAITYDIDELTVRSGAVRAIRLWLSSAVGRVGRPQFNMQGRQLGLEWNADPQPDVPEDAPFEEQLAAIRLRSRRLSGVIKFQEPVTPETSPVSFAVTIPELNADALTRWQFEQFYADGDRLHIDRNAVGEREFYARVAWIPVGTMLVQLTLPAEYDVRPDVSIFRAPDTVPDEAIVHDGEVHLSPAPTSPLSPSQAAWPRVEDEKMEPTLTSIGGTPAWQLTVVQPTAGRCYSLDWKVKIPPANPQLDDLADAAEAMRQALVKHRDDRLAGGDGGAVRQSLLAFAGRIHDLYGDARSDEILSVTLLTYNKISRMIELVDGAVNGGDLRPSLWAFKLPFGLGLAGAAFKSARAQLYVPPSGATESERLDYLKLPGGNDVQILISLPLDHPNFAGPETLADRSRQCIGVIDITSNLPNSRLFTTVRDLAAKENQAKPLGELPDLAWEFSQALHRILVLKS